MNTTTMSITEVKKKDRLWILVFVFAFLAFIADGADILILALTLTSLEAEWGLSQVQKGMLGTYTLMGMTIGGLLGGVLSDRIGRVKTSVICLLFFSVGTAILGATQSYMQFAIIRLISSMGVGGLYISCSILMAEYAPAKYRTTILGSLQAAFSIGFILATLLSGWILPNYGWRWLYYLAIIPVVLAVAIQFVVPEPPSWIVAKKERDAEQLAGRNMKEVKKREFTYKIIFMDREARRMFILWSLTAGFLQFGSYGVSNWLPNYLEKELGIALKSMTLFLVGTYAAGILSKVIMGYAADKIGRRIVYSSLCIGTAISIPIVVLFHTPENIPYFLIIFGFIYGGPYAINATYMSESFATRVRGTAVGGSYNLGKMGALVAPVLIGFIAAHFSIGAGFLLLAGTYLVCGLIPAFFIKDRLFDPQQ